MTVSVTTLIDLLDKPALVYWSNSLGLKGVSLKDYYKSVQKEGTERHNEIENYFRKGDIFNGYELLEESIKGYSVTGVEIPISNGFLIGRMDLVLEKENDKIVVDFKRNSDIYLKTKLQLCSYAAMCGANKVAFINSETFKLEILDLDIEKYFDIVRRLYVIQKTLIELKERL